ncbi:signal transduction histidine kinase [Rarobacter faecitabidus]|uniref:histidine kinase n=1 Tax=Rarobacter faecitabidus TaxID=13243 RepID=A0A542ZU29_RARFA|nr:signal transduction histidine kinase [Rarobacter faecitabidus]
MSWPDRHRALADSVGAVLLALFSLITLTVVGVAGTYTALADANVAVFDRFFPVLITLGIVASLAIRRTRPVLSAAIIYSLALAHMLIGFPLILPADLLVPIALYSVTAYGTRLGYSIAVVGAGAGSIMVAIATMTVDGASSAQTAAFAVTVALIFLAAWAFGLVKRARIEQLNELNSRAVQLERERDEQAVLAATQERTRIAREMHDIVAHSLTVLVAQADGGRYSAAQDPAAAVRSLETIAEVGRAALADMRRLLGVLRADAPATGSRTSSPAYAREARPAATSPQPGIGAVEGLVEQVRAAGIRVSYGVTGRPRELPPGIGLVAYRIVQESLTNVMKHAGPDPSASVMLQWSASTMVVQVIDDGRGASATSDGAGQGVIGMQERIAMVGGTLRAGPRPGGGYQVRFTIPIPSDPAKEPSDDEQS